MASRVCSMNAATSEPAAHCPHRLVEGQSSRHLLAHQLRDDLGISFGFAADACRIQLLPQTHVVLDDAVVDQRDTAVGGSMRMGVHVVRGSMGCPSGVPDAEAARR